MFPAGYIAEGYVAGVATCIFIFAVIAATKAGRYVERSATAIREAAKRADEAMGGGVLPIPRGFVQIPPDDDELARQEIIEENRAQGKDTRISELQA